jgi:hypothetical protein
MSFPVSQSQSSSEHALSQTNEAPKNFLGKTWSWLNKHGPTILTIAAVTAVVAAVTAIGLAAIGGAIALTFAFPHVMLPAFAVVGTGVGGTVLFFALFALGGH